MAVDVSGRPSFGGDCVAGHTIIITDRGGSVRIMELKDVTEVRWSRAGQTRSTASVTITGASCRRQAEKVAKIEPRRHELVIYRGTQRVWEGPIRFVRSSRNAVTISANDVLDYLQARALTRWWVSDNDDELMTERADTIISDELTRNYVAPGTASTVPAWENLTPPIDVLPYLDVRPGVAETAAETLPFSMTVFEHLQELARSGLAFTTVGRRIIIRDASDPIGITRTLTENDIEGDPAIFADGEELICVQHVITQPADNTSPVSTANVGSVVKSTAYYGPWGRIHTRTDEIRAGANVQQALNSQARALAAGHTPVPVELQVGSGATLRLRGGLTLDDLVPGVDVPIVATLMGRTIQRTQRILSMQVVETSEGETIQVSIGGEGTE